MGGSLTALGLVVRGVGAWTFLVLVLVGGLLVAVGLFTQPAAFISAGLMAIAYWMAHGMNHAIPHLNGGELAALYCFVFLFISARGAGIWSFDGDNG